MPQSARCTPGPVEALRRIVRQHNAEIEIAVRAAVTAGGGAEQVDALRVVVVHQTACDFGDGLILRHPPLLCTETGMQMDVLASLNSDHQSLPFRALVRAGAHVLEFLHRAAGPLDHHAARRRRACPGRTSASVPIATGSSTRSSPCAIACLPASKTRTTAPMASRFDLVPVSRSRSDAVPGQLRRCGRGTPGPGWW